MDPGKLSYNEMYLQAQESPSNQAESHINSLCRLCSQALLLNDARAGGALYTNSDGTTVTLDFSRFMADEWSPDLGEGHYWTYSKRSKGTYPSLNQFGWESGRFDHSCRRTCIADTDCERHVTPPEFPELSDLTCKFCPRLKELFSNRSEGDSWWQLPGLSLSFRIRYKWIGCCRNQEAPQYSLKALAVIVLHPGTCDGTADVFKFTVAAWPGNQPVSSCLCIILDSTTDWEQESMRMSDSNYLMPPSNRPIQF